MLLKNDIVAKKYAKAFLNIYFDAIVPETIETFIRLAAFFKRKKGVLYYLTVPRLDDAQRQQLLARFFADCMAIPAVQRLASVLLQQHRIELLPMVLERVVDEYRIRNSIMLFEVSSSHVLDEEQRGRIIAFLAKKTGARVSVSFSVDDTLICGVRMQSKTFMFEQSVADELKKIEQALLQRVAL